MRKNYWIAPGIAASLVLVVRLWRACVPWGASVQPWLLARVDGPALTSPDGQRVVRVYFNDAGAAHSGNHWTWVVEDSWLLGRRVVAEGYLGPAVTLKGGAVPLVWGPNNSLRLDSLPGRHAR